MSEYYIQYKNKVRSPPYCCALLLDPRMPTTSISLSCMRDGTKAVVLLPSQSPQCYRCVVGIFSASLLFFLQYGIALYGLFYLPTILGSN